MKEEKTPTEMRQGETGLGLRQVLTWSIIGAAIALAVILIIFI